LKKHLAGIVPVSGIKTDFNMPWHESLMPIGPNYLAVERAIAECAHAGCDTIWVVCNDDVTPLIRHQVGEKIQDPVYNYRHFEFNRDEAKKPIRIYYVPLAIKDINKRDNLAWSGIFGATCADDILKSLSVHLRPDRFYICWPYGYYDPTVVREHRKKIASENVALQYEGKSVKDNKYLSFTLTIQQINDLIEESISTSSGLWSEDRKNRLSLEQRYSYKNYDLKKVFASLDFSEYEFVSLEDYHPLDCWSGYCQFLSKQIKIKKPKILRYSEWNEIGMNDD